MSTAPKINKEKFRDAILTYRGIKSDIARSLGCARQTVENYLVRWPDLEADLLEERDKIIDLAESKLIAAIEGGEVKAIIFALETLGKKRGYVKRIENTGNDGGPLTVRIVRGEAYDAPAATIQSDDKET